MTDETTVSNDKREYDRNQPVALDDRDPSNTDVEELTEALDPNDNVYQLLHPDQGDLREVAPMQEPEHGQ